MSDGYLAQPFKEIQNNDYDALLYCKTNIAGFFFDGFLNVSHERKLTTTSSPVETGAAIVDHAYVEPAKITMKIIVSDVHQSLIPGQFDGGYARHTQAWQLLKQLQNDRIPMYVFTKLDTYENMLITSITADDNADTFQCLIADVELTEIPVARVKEVKITKADQTTVNTEMGKVTGYNVDQSVLKSLINYWNSFIGGG